MKNALFRDVTRLADELAEARAREAKLVEALRECVMCARHSWPPLVDFDALLAPYDTPAEMPSDCHPEGQ